MIKKIEKKQMDDLVIGRLLDIWESAVTDTHAFLTPKDIEEIKAEVKAGVIEIEELYCYFDGSNVIQGFIGVEKKKIEMLFVHGNSRGQGVGKELLNFAVDALDAVYVDVNEDNIQGVGFYKHIGFREFERSEKDPQGRPFPIIHMKISSI